MEGSATLTFGQLISIAVFPAAITALVSIFTPLASQWVMRGQAKYEKRIQKIEEIIAAIYDLNAWVDARKTILVGKTPDETNSPLWRVVAISATYFPEFEKNVQNLDLALTSYMSTIFAMATDKKPEDAIDIDRFGKAWKEYMIAERDMLQVVRAYASRKLKG